MVDFIDSYLEDWDRFAQGANELVSQLNQDGPQFTSELADLLRAGDPRAPARAVFFAVVQVGGFIPVESELGRALAQVVGDAVSVTRMAGKPDTFFAGDLYFWWLEHKGRFEPFALLDEWLARDFACQTAIPMYQAVRQGAGA